MHNTSIFFHHLFSEKAIKIHQSRLDASSSIKMYNQPKMKSVPSQLSLSLIIGYASALQVVRYTEEISFDIIKN